MTPEEKQNLEDNVSQRWSADDSSDSWLAKNIRPLVLIFIVFNTMLLVYLDALDIDFEVKEDWVNLLEMILVTVIAAYFGGRSIEKINIKKK